AEVAVPVERAVDDLVPLDPRGVGDATGQAGFGKDVDQLVVTHGQFSTGVGKVGMPIPQVRSDNDFTSKSSHFVDAGSRESSPDRMRSSACPGSRLPPI